MLVVCPCGHDKKSKVLNVTKFWSEILKGQHSFEQLVKGQDVTHRGVSKEHVTVFIIFLIFLGVFTNLQKTNISVFMSVDPHGKTRLPMGGFSLNFTLEYFLKICQENSSFIKI